MSYQALAASPEAWHAIYSTVASKRHGREGRLGMLTNVQGLQAAEERVLYCFSGLRAIFASVILQKLRKNYFNSSVMAGEEAGKMPELYLRGSAS